MQSFLRDSSLRDLTGQYQLVTRAYADTHADMLLPPSLYLANGCGTQVFPLVLMERTRLH